MKALLTGMLLFLFGITVPAFAQEEHHEEGAKPAAKQEQGKPQKQEQQAKPPKQEQAKPEKQQQQAKPQKEEQQTKSQEENQQKHSQQQAKSQEENQHRQQVKTQQNEEKNQQRQQQQANGHAQQSQGKYAHDGQKDNHGHVYSESRFGRDHHARFEENGGRYYDGRRAYSYGGYWFYAGAYPVWFYQRDVYFVMGADGLWYAVAYDDPSLTFQVNIE